jgi:hypothetical protein
MGWCIVERPERPERCCGFFRELTSSEVAEEPPCSTSNSFALVRLHIRFDNAGSNRFCSTCRITDDG